jgi:hypothetical protein
MAAGRRTDPARERFMASELGYGQPMGGIAQTAFIVPNLHEAIGRWVTDMRAGPFFVLPHFLVPGQTYRGEESRADIAIGMGFAGHMLIELIQPLDERSPYAASLAEHSGADHVHHVRFEVEDYERAGARLDVLGLRRMLDAEFAGADGVSPRFAGTYFDARDELGFIVEIGHAPPGFSMPAPELVYPGE